MGKDGAGSRFGELELEIGAYNTIVTDHQGPTAAAIGEALGMSADDILHHPHCLIGSVDYMCEELERRRETYGISISPYWMTVRTIWWRRSRRSLSAWPGNSRRRAVMLPTHGRHTARVLCI